MEFLSMRPSAAFTCFFLLVCQLLFDSTGFCFGVTLVDEGKLELRNGEKVALVGNSLAERMNLHGHFETHLHLAYPEKKLKFRNFGFPADEVGNQQRPNNYTKIDDPFTVFGPETFALPEILEKLMT